MTTDTSRPSRPHRQLPPRADRRRSMLLKNLPLIGGLGLVLNDRRSHRDRRRQPRQRSHGEPCALLCRPEQIHRGPFAGIGSWFRRHFPAPWRE